MRAILVIDRRHLFPGLSPQGFLPTPAIDLGALSAHLFFAEREYMETCSHYKQIIPYLVLVRGDGRERRVLAYQRQVKHSERRLGGLWSVGFGGHIEPIDRADREVAIRGLVEAAARRELAEETGLDPAQAVLEPAGYINSDREDVSSVHLGVVYRVDVAAIGGSDAALLATVSAQAEPHQARWLPVAGLATQQGPARGPDSGTFEDWTRIVVEAGAI
ncbi:MAG TPA: NUDIX domain-containing protein [Candidatus Krumholzibacteria bacterium]|nr:NUDIX domain-containing protein [Candidatus Krumholzibacteria bacterium]HPD70778.1 NUDIX domain-containing protein [Candidatus Krumholzibacteria bacterium]HRY39522.1 NUDIX domain-containing protein [Candidatus Krumholzibacteria bacterium]